MEVVEAPFYDAYYNPCFCQKCVLIVNDLQQKRKISQKIGVFCLFVGVWPFFFCARNGKKGAGLPLFDAKSGRNGTGRRRSILNFFQKSGKGGCQFDAFVL